ncbi:Hypothetical predicted protein [Cloeon dipterum]|uniref:EF-hand domain-containing protein n=1 Tax=Cloeon dipterum TaxID=197152 RepID=A0A8S1DTP0_9INSE|nr:Hypothetical predicted protein [Cloeon dipterum]
MQSALTPDSVRVQSKAAVNHRLSAGGKLGYGYYSKLLLLKENGVAQDGEADVAAQEEAESAAAVAERKKSVKKKEKSAAKQKAEEEAALAQENKMRELAEVRCLVSSITRVVYAFLESEPRDARVAKFSTTHNPIGLQGFFLLDWNKDGQIDKTDLQMTFASLGFPNVSDEEIQGMLSEASSPLDIDSFVELMGKKVETMDAEELLVKALSCWDEDSSGFISEERIRHDLMKWGDTFTEQEVNYALEDAPLYEEPEGLMINYIEFCKILCGSAAKN